MEDKIEHISKAWPNAEIWQSYNGNISVPFISSYANNITNLVLLIGIIIFLAFFYSRIIDGIKFSFIAIKKMKDMLSIDTDIAVLSSRSIFLFFSIAIVFLICINNNVLTINFWDKHLNILTLITLTIITASIYLLRRFSIKIIGWINNSDIFIRLHKASLFYLGGALTVCLPFLLIANIFTQTSPFYFYLVLGLSFLPFYLLFFIRSGRLILSNGFSVFFYIVYLCTLEILPFLILVKLFS